MSRSNRPYDQMIKYATALRLGTAETEAILRRFTKQNVQHPTYKAFAELGKAIVWPAVGRFPIFARDARPARVDPAGHNQIGLAERKVVTVALAAATDALQRSIIGGGTGVGLRAGRTRPAQTEAHTYANRRRSLSAIHSETSHPGRLGSGGT